jgi:hypothetical protein
MAAVRLSLCVPAQLSPYRGARGPALTAAAWSSPAPCNDGCSARGPEGIERKISTPAAPASGHSMDHTARRGNYESGSDYVLEYGELRFTFNERDFTERVEQAAAKLGFVDGPLGDDEREDLVNLAVNGEVTEPHSELGEHINECWGDLNGPSERSLVHWIRRLVFRGAWLDQRVMEGELELVFDETDNSFGYAQPDRNFELIELSPEPSWQNVAYRR